MSYSNLNSSRTFLVVLILVGCCISPPLMKAQVTYTTLPSVGVGVDDVFGISGSNVAGTYSDSSGVEHGYLYNLNTHITTKFSAPNGSSLSISGISGNNVTGSFTGKDGYFDDFLYNGVFKSIPLPANSYTGGMPFISGSTVVNNYTINIGPGQRLAFIYSGSFSTIPHTSRDLFLNGQRFFRQLRAGTYENIGSSFGDDGSFIYDIANGRFTKLPVNWGSYPVGVPISGDDVMINQDKIYLYNAVSGNLSTIPLPNDGAQGISEVYGVAISGGNIVGAYVNGNTILFTYNGEGDGASSDIPIPNDGEVYVSYNYAETYISGNSVAGSYPEGKTVEGYPISHGFFYDISAGNFTVIDPPGSKGTTIVGVDGNTVVGGYVDSAGVGHKFVATVTPAAIKMQVRRGTAFTNGTAAAGADDGLIPVPDPVVLANPVTSPLAKGLIADGVTPLILEFDSTGTSTTSTNYTLSMGTPVGGSFTSSFGVQQLQVLSNGQWAPGTMPLAISSTQPGFAYVPGLPAELISYAAGSTQVTVPLFIQKSNGTGPLIKLPAIHIRKPPIVLVHGYNATMADTGTFSGYSVNQPCNGWRTEFLANLQSQVGSDFVAPVTYGDKGTNTFDDLEPLAQLLSNTLSLYAGSVENHVYGPFAGWAFTRYDLVCHSQGGVLARMLCMSGPGSNTEKTPFGTVAFRSAANYYRGRFRRIVTIGSPQNGTRLLHYLSNLKHSNNLAYRAVPAFLSVTGVLQPKFDPFLPQIQAINNSSLTVDPGAKFHLISTQIDDGKVPNVTPLTLLTPLEYLVTGLGSTVPGQTYTRGQVVVGGSGGASKFGSPDTEHGGGFDGVVDVQSQQAGAGSKTSLFPDFDGITQFIDNNVAHSDVFPLFGVPAKTSDTSDPDMATYVAKFLSAPESDGLFGPFVLPQLLTTKAALGNASDEAAIDAVTPHLVSGGLLGLIGSLTNSAPKTVQASPSTTSPSYQLTVAANEPLQGSVTWYAEVYAPGGVNSNGVTVTPNANDSTQVTVVIDPSVVGDVVLKASYTSTTGDLVFPDPIVVVSKPSTATQTGISLLPSPATATVGEASALELDKVYDDGTTEPVFLTSAAPAQFSSSDPTVLTVDTYGEMQGVAAGVVTVTGSYGGFSTQATVSVGAPGLGPQITSASTASGPAYQSFSFPITATENPTTFAATGLPPGLNIDPTTGIISGKPTLAGTYAATLTVGNGTLYPDTDTLTVTVTPSAIPDFNQWKARYFNTAQLADSTISGTTATPQHDGVPNLFKYFHDIDPSRPMTAADKAVLPVTGMDSTTTPGTNYLTLTYRQSASMVGITVNVQTSSDLKTWSNVVPPDLSQKIGTDANTGDPLMKVGIKASGAGRQFIRLNVTMP